MSTASTTQKAIRHAAQKAKPEQVPGLPHAMRHAHPIAAQWCVGIVERDEQGLRVSSGGWQAHAIQAASCLLEPATGDSVACLQVAPDQVWIVGILAREDGATNVLHLQGETELRVSQGALKLQADTLTTSSQHLHMASQTAEVAVDSAHVAGRQLKLTAGAIKLVGSLLSTTMERIQQFSKSYWRSTDGLDRVSATHIEMQAQQLMQLNAQHTLVSGEQLVKARGAQIHFG
jgi:Protein of unknown function (DUF3540)